MSKKTKVVFYILYVFFLSLISVEFVSRIIFSDYANDNEYLQKAFDRVANSSVIFRNHPDNLSKKLGFRYTPNATKKIIASEFKYTFKTNSLGFRSKEIVAKKNNEYRVLLIGDSMFAGVGSDDDEVIDAQLKRISEKKFKPNRSLSVYNYAVSSYNTVQELIVLRTFVQELQPDLIILGFFVGNDVIPNAVSYIDSNGNYAVSYNMIKEIKSEIRSRYSIFWHSTIFRIVSLKVYVPKIRYQIAKTHRVIEKSYSLLKQFQNYTEANGISFSVLILYPADGVQGGLIELWSQSRDVGRMLVDFCKGEGIDVVDMLDFMNGSNARNLYMYKKDKHFNSHGNRKIARIIFNEIIDSL